MRFATLAPVTDQVPEMEQLYGRFDINLEGLPTETWRGRNLKRFRPPEVMSHAFFPEVYVNRIWVNRRIYGPIGAVYNEIVTRWTTEARKAYGLNQFVKCYCFGEGAVPNLFWYGGAWELSPQVNGEILTEVIKVFTRHGFTHDRKRLRTFEYW